MLRSTSSTPATIKAKIIEYSFWLLKQGYRESTIVGRTRLLKILVKRGADLFDPESVKKGIAEQKTWCEGRKANAVDAYTCFLSMIGKKWDPPRYVRIHKLPFVPTEQEVDQLIAGCGKKMTAYLQLLKETGMRAGEAWNLKWTELDTVNNTVRVTPEKNSNPRMFRVSNKLMAMLNGLPKVSEKVFGTVLMKSHQRSFQKQRRRIADRLKNPRIRQISFLTLRHFKGTMEYHKTKDILHVMKVLGHKNINNTLIYTHLVNFKEDEFIVRVASKLKEACQLVQAGYEYVTEMNGNKIFRKRK